MCAHTSVYGPQLPPPPPIAPQCSGSAVAPGGDTATAMKRAVLAQRKKAAPGLV